MTHEETTLQTKTALATSLKKFMTRKPLSKITVNDLITDCNVNRKTFYYHFENIYDLLKWMLEQEAIEVVRTFDLLVDYEEAIHFIIDYVQSNAHILNCAYDSMGRDEMKRFFYQDFYSVIKNIIDDCERSNGLFVDAGFKSFLCDLLTEGTAGMLVNGFKDEKKLTEQHLTENVTILLDSMPDILRHAPAKK